MRLIKIKKGYEISHPYNDNMLIIHILFTYTLLP